MAPSALSGRRAADGLEVSHGGTEAQRRGEAVSHMIKHATQRVEADAASRDAAWIDGRGSVRQNLAPGNRILSQRRRGGLGEEER